MINKIQTGIKGLDEILIGGLPELSVCMVAGLPGTGKTILTQNILYNVANQDNKVLYICTSSEPQAKVIRYQKEMSYFSHEKFLSSVIYRDFSEFMTTDKIAGMLSELNKVVIEYRPYMLVIDSFKVIGELLPYIHEFRDFLTKLTVMLSAWECTTILVGEYDEKMLKERPESSIADGIIFLYGTEEQKFQKRYLRVLKMRGSSYLPGQNYFEISEQGINVYPRLNPEYAKQSYPCRSKQRMTFGIPKLDEMLGGGLPKGTSTLIAGQTGTGKTTLSLHWLLNGVLHGEKCLLVSFEENPKLIEFKASNFNLGGIKEKNLTIKHISPIELDLDKHTYEMTKFILENQITQMVIDSIDAFEISMVDKFKYTDYICTLVDFAKNHNVSLMIICRTLKHSLTKYGTSFLADNIINMHHVRLGNSIRKSIAIIKIRESEHNSDIKELIINGNGIEIRDFDTIVKNYSIEGNENV